MKNQNISGQGNISAYYDLKRNRYLFFWLLVIPFVISCYSITGCEKNVTNPPLEIDPDKITVSLEDFGDANIGFAFDLLHETINQSEEGKNAIVSPLSVHVALQMVLNGADGETYDSILSVLHSSEYSESTLNSAYSGLVSDLENAGEKSELNIANSVFWDRNKIDPRAEFREKMVNFYNAHLEDLDFPSPEALTNINDWVNTNTEGRIEKILEEIKPEEVMFLINALYFKGNWEVPFPEEGTYERNFKLANGGKIPLPTMHHDAEFLFFMDHRMHAVDLVFEDSLFSMSFIRPADDTESIDAFIQTMDEESLKNLWSKQIQRSRLMLGLPKFEVEYDANLNDILKALGMEIAFDRNRANLSRLGESIGNLFINRVKHKTYLKIDETGAEGAAVTAVGVGVTSAPPVIFFDRSFMIVLRDIRYNSILFAGKIENPVEG